MGWQKESAVGRPKLVDRMNDRTVLFSPKCRAELLIDLLYPTRRDDHPANALGLVEDDDGPSGSLSMRTVGLRGLCHGTLDRTSRDKMDRTILVFRICAQMDEN